MEHTAQHRAERSGAETTMSGRTRMWEKRGVWASTSKIVTVAEPNVEKVTSEGTQRVERISHALMPFLCSCFYCTPSHVRFIQSEEIPFQSIIFIKNFPYTHDASLYMCHIGAVLACNNNNNESELIHTIEMRQEKSVSAQLTCEMKWVGVKWSEQEREFLCQNFALPHTENFLNDFLPLNSSIALALTGSCCRAAFFCHISMSLCCCSVASAFRFSPRPPHSQTCVYMYISRRHIII